MGLWEDGDETLGSDGVVGVRSGGGGVGDEVELAGVGVDEEAVDLDVFWGGGGGGGSCGRRLGRRRRGRQNR